MVVALSESTAIDAVLRTNMRQLAALDGPSN